MLHNPLVTDSPKRRVPTWLPISAVFLTLCGGLAYILLGSEGSDAFVYSKPVERVTANPAAFAGQQLRVEGALQSGSIRFREKPCEWRFVLHPKDGKEGKSMPVSFPQCIVPDTFRDGMGITVTVQGEIQNDGRFLANQVVPRCPSKYEMRERQQNGEQMPHSPTPARANPVSP